MNNQKTITRFEDLIENAQPQESPTFDKEGNFKGAKANTPTTIQICLNESILNEEQLKEVPKHLRQALTRELTTSNSTSIVNASKPNLTTWKHVIISSNILARAGVSYDTSGNFEGFPYFSGFDSSVGTEWLGENAEIPESSSLVARFPYEIHTIGAFTLVSRRMKVLNSQLIPQVKIAQANAIKESVEEALLCGDPALNPHQPKGLVNQITKNVLLGTDKRGLAVVCDALNILESNGLDASELSIIVSPDVAKKWRLEPESFNFESIGITPRQILVSKHMPQGTVVTGRYSDFQAVVSPNIEMLSHTFTPKGQPETGAVRIRSLFDVDGVLLNQDSFVKCINI